MVVAISYNEDILHYYPLAKTQQKWAKSGQVVVGRRPCEPLNNPTLLSLGGGSHLKRESHLSPIGLVFLGDWAFPRGVRQSTVLRLPRFRSLGPSGLLRLDRCVVFSAVGAKIVGFGESGSLCRAFHPIPPGPDSSFDIRAGPLLRGWE